MPVQSIETASLSIIGYNKPASETGGDLWGHYSLGNGLEFVFCADATGHGAAAAFVTAMAHACCMTVLEQFKGREHSGESVPGAVASMVNRVLYQTTRTRMAMTFQAFLIDTNTGNTWLTNAGHPFPLVVRREGTTQPAKQVSFLRVAGNPLGMFDDSAYETKAMQLEPGEKLILYSDGLTEGRSPAGKMLGREKVRRIVASVAQGGATELHDALVQQSTAYFDGAEQDDDITIVVVERRAGAATALAEPRPAVAGAASVESAA